MISSSGDGRLSFLPHFPESGRKIMGSDRKGGKILPRFSRDGGCDRLHSGVLAKSSKIGAVQPSSRICHGAKIEVAAKGGVAAMGFQDRKARIAVRLGKVDDEIEPARPQERWVDEIGAVGRRQHDHAGIAADRIQFEQELPHHPVADLTVSGALAAYGRDRVDFVEDELPRVYRRVKLSEDEPYGREEDIALFA
jgi:hypothetical protein